MTDPIIEFDHVSKQFGDKVVFENANFTIQEGNIVGIVGPSGMGKSTLFRLILGTRKPTNGTVRIAGELSHFRKKVGFASQEYSFYPELHVEENLRYFGKMYNIPTKTLEPRITKLLDLVQLSHARKTKAKDISGGMKRRLDLALALISDPKILILDEPTTGLDVVLRDAIWNVISTIHKEGTTILVASHDLTEIQHYCKSVLFVLDRKIHTQKEMEKIAKTRSKHLEDVFRRVVDVS